MNRGIGTKSFAFNVGHVIWVPHGLEMITVGDPSRFYIWSKVYLSSFKPSFNYIASKLAMMMIKFQFYLSADQYNSLMGIKLNNTTN